MSKADKIHAILGVLAAISFLAVAGWAQWGSEPFPGGPNDYSATINALKWTCIILCLGSLYLTKLINPQRI